MPIEELHATQGISRPLEEEEWNVHILKVSDAEPILPASRVERVRIENDPGCGKVLSYQIGRHTPPHRPARQEEIIDACAQEFGSSAVGLDQPLGAIGPIRAPLGVGIIEGHHRVALPGQPIPKGSHERMLLVRPGAVGEEHTGRA